MDGYHLDIGKMGFCYRFPFRPIEFLRPIRERLLSDLRVVEVIRKLEPYYNIPPSYAWD